MGDLPDWYSWVETVLTRVSTLDHGADAAKAATPNAGDAYLATDTEKLYVCYTGGEWTDITAACLLLAGGTMTGAIAMGANKITGLADPTAAQDAATKAYADLHVLKSLFDAYTILYADTDDTPAALAIAASTLVGRKATGGITTLAAADIFTLLGIIASATELNYVDGVTSAIQTQLDAKVAKALFDAYTILYADTDDTPAALAIAASRLVGRKATGGIAALTGAEVLTIIGRIGKGNFEWTANKFLKGAGTGADPTEIDLTGRILDATTGDNLEVSADTARSGGDDTYVKVKEIKLGRGGAYRIKFDIKSANVAVTVSARVYKNGAAFGTSQSTTSLTYVTKSEDISGWSEDDLCQLYIKVDTGWTWYCQNFRIYADSPFILSSVETD